MRSLVVYESWFGNTRRLAEEVAAELRREGEVAIVSVDETLPGLEDVDLLIVGAPTHVHGLSSRRSRQGALDQGADGEVGIGVRGWIDALPNGAGGPILTFDGDSDAHIVRGLIAILLTLYSGKSPQHILATNAVEVFDEFGFRDHLTPQRSNGLRAMVERIRGDARAALATAS